MIVLEQGAFIFYYSYSLQDLRNKHNAVKQ